jgi:hypothetical protein
MASEVYSSSTSSMSSKTLKSKKYVDMSDPLYDEILAGIRKSYADSCVLWIEDVRNEELEEGYSVQKAEIIQKRGEVKEKMLYHGTNEDSARVIIRDGFLPSANRRSVFGKGSYFARDAIYSKHYAPPSDISDVSYLLLCSVLVGAAKTYGNNEEIDTTHHDNSVDNTREAARSIYVTPYRYGAVPRYLVAFYKGV